METVTFMLDNSREEREMAKVLWSKLFIEKFLMDFGKMMTFLPLKKVDVYIS